MKSQPSVWKKILANYIPDKGLIYKIHKELTTQHQKHNQPDFKMGRGSEQTFFQRKTYRWPTGT